MEQRPYSDNWNNKILDNYFETLDRSLKVTASIESNHCTNTEFLSFYQPFQVPEEFRATHERIKYHLSTIDYAFDVSSEYDNLGKEIFIDAVHVKQEAKDLMGRKIAAIILEELRSGRLDCDVKP